MVTIMRMALPIKIRKKVMTIMQQAAMRIQATLIPCPQTTVMTIAIEDQENIFIKYMFIYLARYHSLSASQVKIGP